MGWRCGFGVGWGVGVVWVESGVRVRWGGVVAWFGSGVGVGGWVALWVGSVVVGGVGWRCGLGVG